jgi:hypothetical protein
MRERKKEREREERNQRKKEAKKERSKEKRNQRKKDTKKRKKPGNKGMRRFQPIPAVKWSSEDHPRTIKKNVFLRATVRRRCDPG